MMHITRSRCRKFIETMSNVFTCSIISYSCRLYEPPTPRTGEYITHSFYEPHTPRTDEYITHSLYELPARVGGS
jgi:hypothetical protein